MPAAERAHASPGQPVHPGQPAQPAHALHEVARPAADLPQARASLFGEREVSQAKPIASFLDQSRAPAPTSSPLLGPDDLGRAGGAVDAAARPAPAGPPRYQPPGPFPQGQPLAAEPPRPSAPALGQPAPAPRSATRWQPGEDSGPKPAAPGPAWNPPSFEPVAEPEPEPEPAASVWTPPNWLLKESARPAAAAPVEAPSWEPPAAEAAPTLAEPSWGRVAADVGAPVWTPPDHTPIWSPVEPHRPPGHTPAPRQPASTFPVDDDDEFEDFGFDDREALPAPAERSPRRHGRIHDPIDDPIDDRVDAPVAVVEPVRAAPAIEHVPVHAERPRAVEPEPEPRRTKPEAKPEAKPPAKPKRPKDDDDDFDDDDDDDFDDDDDDDEETGSMPAMSDGAMSAIAAKSGPRKLPWIPIAAFSGFLVLVLAFVFKDAILGGDDDEAVADGEPAADSGKALDEPTPPEPEPEPEPKDETSGQVAPPEPAPPKIDPEVLEAKLAEADTFYRKAKHDKAREVLDGILAESPKEPRALALLAQVLLEKGEFETALATANDCIAVDDKEPNCWMTIAVVEQENKNFPRALEGFQKYLEIAPEGRFAKSAQKQVSRLQAKVSG